jgi:hypothetical protein
MSADIVPFRQNEPPSAIEWMALLEKLSREHREAIVAPIETGATLIDLCKRLLVLHDVIDAALDLIDDAADDDFLDPLQDRWDEIVTKVCEFGTPADPEGARAVARVLLARHPDGVCPSDPFSDWLAVRCAEYLTRGAPA